MTPSADLTKFSLELKADERDAYSKAEEWRRLRQEYVSHFFMVTSFLNSLLVYGCTFMVDGNGGSVKQKNLHKLYKLYKTI